MNYNLILNKTVMRTSLTVCAIALSSQLLCAEGVWGQSLKENNITYVVKQTSVSDVFEQLSKITGFNFFYDESVLKDLKNVNVQIKNGSIDAILNELSQQTGLYFKKINNTISVSRSRIVSFEPQTIQQNKKLTGIIRDNNGEPIIGANVVVKGTTNGTITGVDGDFSLDVPGTGTLLISYIGYLSKEIAIGTESRIDITLSEDTQKLDEIVVVGYGVVRKSDLTGSVGTVKGAAIESMPVSRIDQALQGRVSGMQITSANGSPGASTTIRIRGGNSINAGNEPLYVIDGIIGGGDLSTINPADIASIEVLKDASSTAIYGSRGANGVILITTKRGDGAEGLKLTYSGYYGLQTPVKKLDLLNGQEAAVFQNEYAEYYGRPHPFKDPSQVNNTNWQDQMFRSSAPITDHNLSLSKSMKDGNYYLSMNYFNQEGIMYESGFERYQIRFNVDQKIGKAFQLGATLTASMTNRDNPFVGGHDLLPTAPIYNEDGSYFDVNQISGNVYNSPVAQREYIQDKTRKFRGLGNVYAQLTLFKNLVLKSSFGFDISHSKQNRYESVNLPTRVFNKTGGYAKVRTEFPITYQNENTISYNITLGDHFISALGGFTWQKYQYEFLEGSASGFKNDVSLYHAMETGDPVTRDIQTGEKEWGLVSYLFRANYTYKSRYMLTVSGRQDGSSRLSEGNKWAFFPSVAFAWRASEEEFIKSLSLFSNLKLRASYGTSGSQAIDPYSVIDKLKSGSTVIGGQEVISFAPESSANKNLGWEKTKQVDVGLDAGFLEGRLGLEIDYYYKKTTDLLLKRELPYQTGFESILENVGAVRNQGFEISVNSVNIDKKDFKWSTNLSISANRNKILDLGGKDFIENGRGSRLIVGEPMGTFFGVKYLGTWKENEIAEDSKHKPGDPKLEDLNDDDIINIHDGQIIGNAEPKFYGGFGNDFTFKRFTFGLFFDFSYGNDVYDLSGRGMDTGFNGNVYGRNRDRWSESNPNGYYPKAGSAFTNIFDTYAGGEFNGGCSLYLHDGSYLRLKNINVQYDIPLSKQNVLKSLQVYGTVSNVFTLTKYFGYSPDVNVGDLETEATRRGFDQNAYPQSRTFLIGLKAQF